VRAAGGDAPDGYERLALRDVEAVVTHDCAAALASVLRAGTLYAYAAAHPTRRELAGRAAAYAVPLGGRAVVVRHSRHGGLLAPLTGDRFLPPTRAPGELRTALRLARAGVPTPPVVATVVYAAGPLLRTADVATGEVAGARDLSVALAEPERQARAAALGATATLLHRLAEAGARHPDLNLKNVLVAADRDGGVVAHVIDVDRVTFEGPSSDEARRANARRLLRSIEKWRDRLAPGAADEALSQLSAAAGVPVAA